MYTNENTAVFLNAGGSARLTPKWIREYAHILWEIIGIGDEPIV